MISQWSCSYRDSVWSCIVKANKITLLYISLVWSYPMDTMAIHALQGYRKYLSSYMYTQILGYYIIMYTHVHITILPPDWLNHTTVVQILLKSGTGWLLRLFLGCKSIVKVSAWSSRWWTWDGEWGMRTSRIIKPVTFVSRRYTTVRDSPLALLLL